MGAAKRWFGPNGYKHSMRPNRATREREYEPTAESESDE